MSPLSSHHVPTCAHMPTTPKWRRSYDLDMSHMGVMWYPMLMEDVLKKKFGHPHAAVGLILAMFYLVENTFP